MDKELLEAIREELNPIKQDITRLKAQIEQDIPRLRAQIEQDIPRLRVRVEQDIPQLMTQMEQDISRLKTLMENDIPKQINLLAEGQSLILERLPKTDEVRELSDRVDILEIVVRNHSAEIVELKNAL